MQTLIMHQGAASACLESYNAKSSRPEVMSLESFPINLARSESCALIREVRRIHEQTTQFACPTRFEEIVELHSGATYGYQAVHEGSSGASNSVRRVLQSTECRLLARLTRLARAVAVRDAGQLPRSAHLFLPLESFEVGLDDLPASLDQLGRLSSPKRELVVEISASAACDIPYFRELLRSIREFGIAFAYDGFASGHAQIQQFRDSRPDYLKLNKTTTDGILCNADRQRKLQALAKAAANIDCDLIAVDLQGSGEADVCRDLGCRFAQGTSTTGQTNRHRPSELAK